jgi:hypothetical protein
MCVVKIVPETGRGAQNPIRAVLVTEHVAQLAVEISG